MFNKQFLLAITIPIVVLVFLLVSCIKSYNLLLNNKNQINLLSIKIHHLQNLSTASKPMFANQRFISDKLILIESLLNVAQLQNVVFQEIKTENSRAITLKIQANLQQFLLFLHRITQDNFISQIHSISIDANTPNLTIIFGMSLFGIYPDTRVAQHTEFQRLVESAKNSEEKSKILLTYFPLRTLKIAGYIYQDAKLSALIKLPNGETYRVRTGDKIGKEQAEITEMTDKKLRVKLGSILKELQR